MQEPQELQELTWKQAREALTESGRGANEAQDILDDLAHWGPGKSFAVNTGAECHWLRYAGSDPVSGPLFTSEDRSVHEYRELAAAIARQAQAISEGRVTGPFHAAASLLSQNAQRLLAWTPDDRK